MTTPKEYVQQRFPKATFMYRDTWDSLNRRFRRKYSVYTIGEIDAFTALSQKIGEASTLEAAWVNAMFNIETH